MRSKHLRRANAVAPRAWLGSHPFGAILVAPDGETVPAEQRDAELSCRDVFAASPHPIECIGPVMVPEAEVPHLGFWTV